MCYTPSGYIIFSLRKLKFYGSQGPDMRGGGRITQAPARKPFYLHRYFFSIRLNTHIQKNERIIKRRQTLDIIVVKYI